MRTLKVNTCCRRLADTYENGENTLIGEFDGGNVLTSATYALLPAHAGPKVIYAAGCRFSRERQKRENLTFKQTPYAIRLQ